MKLLCSLIAILMLALSCIPCSDADNCTMKGTGNNQVNLSLNQASTPTESEHKDICSPFCQCSCCAVAYALPQPIITEMVTKIVPRSSTFAFYLQQNPVGITLPVWQPPRLV